MKGQTWLISCIKRNRKNIVISSGIAIFSDVSKQCNILLSQYIAIKMLSPDHGIVQEAHPPLQIEQPLVHPQPHLQVIDPLVLDADKI